MKNKKIILFFLFLFCFIPLVALAEPSEYKIMEGIPGFLNAGEKPDFPKYIMAIYKFGLWTIGIAAMLMIMIGGYMYLTSGGNTSQTGKAKGIITDAIVGIILALTSWLLLYTINPDLVDMGSSSTLAPLPGAPGTGAAGLPGTPAGPSGTTAGFRAACPDNSSRMPIDYGRAASDNNIRANSNCDRYDFSNSSGIDPGILKAIAQLESSCGANKGPSSANACGLMQLLTDTANRLARRTDITCEILKNDDRLSIELAAKYVAEGYRTSCVSNARDPEAAIFAGYNSGYGCDGRACSPKKHALCASRDCSEANALAYECCINPGGLVESINYAWNGIGLIR